MNADTQHSTTIGPYHVERIVRDHDWTVEFTETWDGVAESHGEWTPDVAKRSAGVIRDFAAELEGAERQRELDLADAIEDLAREPELCRCGHRWASWMGLCSVCDAREPSGGAA